MTIRWRLTVLAVQLAILALVTHVVVGTPYSAQTWFIAGLLALIINPQLLEPHYPRPGDVIGNSLFFFFLYATTPKSVTKVGWISLAVALSLASIFALTALLLGAGRKDGPAARLGRAARSISQVASARVIYSAVFILSVLEWRPSLDIQLWLLLVAWMVILFIGGVNWQNMWAVLSRGAEVCQVEGMIGPSMLLLTSPDIPSAGNWVTLRSRERKILGVVVNRIGRVNDTWAQIHVVSQEDCEALLRATSVTISQAQAGDTDFVGSVDAGSTDESIRFLATRHLETGKVVAVQLANTNEKVLYQLSSAVVERSEVRGGSHLVVRAQANQLGRFDETSQRFVHYRWVPAPGSVVLRSPLPTRPKEGSVSESWLSLGSVVSTEVPIYMDCKLACEGHLAILGMTKMGKTTLASRLANALAATRRVTVLDQTGEYVGKRGLQPCTKETDWKVPGISVLEPKPEEVAPDRALKFLRFLVGQAVEEYKSGTPFPRTVIIDEAHQFIPEPAGLGFNAPGRDSSFTIGLLMMQVRKYGISVILISQRTAVVAKSALSQCENLIAFRSVDQTGLDYLEAIAGSGIRLLLPRLQQGEAIVFGPAMSCETPAAVKVEVGAETTSTMNPPTTVSSNPKPLTS